jgi:hypothetical protein
MHPALPQKKAYSGDIAMVTLSLRKRLLGVLLLGALLSPQCLQADASLPGLKLVLALTDTAQHPPVTTLSLRDIKSGTGRSIYQDGAGDRRVLVRIASSDVLGAVRITGSSTVYAMRGPAEVESQAACSDALSRLRLTAGEDAAEWEPIFPVPLCFSDASPYGLWNRAPLFAVSPDGSRIALPALRIGDERLERPAIRVLSATGAEEWRVPLPGEWMEVADLAWSPDARLLAYVVRPQGDEHTVDEAQLSAVGLYLADIGARRTRRISDCRANSLAWGPERNQITVALETATGHRGGGPISVLRLPDGIKVEEFSAKGTVTALAYSDDLQWLAVQATIGDQQIIWLYHASGGWARRVYQLPTSAGRLSLVGWASDPETDTGM